MLVNTPTVVKANQLLILAALYFAALLPDADFPPEHSN
jgi:hypothetical protein